MYFTGWRKKSLIFSFILLGLICLSLSAGSSVTLAQSDPAFIRWVRALEADQTGLSNPAGLAFTPGAQAFYAVEGRGPGQPPPPVTDIIKLTPFGDRAGSAQIAAAIRDPLNMAFDSRFNRLLIFQSPNNHLLAVVADPNGNLDPATLSRHDARHFGLGDPQGMAVDPASGQLFILDSAVPRLMRIEPEPDGSFDQAVISAVDLTSTGLVEPRGLALDPTSGHLHVVNPAEQVLYELTQTGQVVTTRNLAEFQLGGPQGMVFAPSGDQTDDPLELSLYLADSGLVAGPGRQPRLAPEGQSYAQSPEGQAAAQSSGEIVELSFVELAAPAASTFTSSLVNTVDMSQWSPPSPDPSGLAYLPNSNTLLMCDGEVEETVTGITHFQGANVWEMTLSGSVVRTANISKIAPTVVPMSNEPTGVAWSPANGHFFFSHDDGSKVFDLNPGADGLVGTADDRWTSFDTRVWGNNDAEGIAYDSWHNHLFVADGVNMEVYEYTLSGSLVGQFDVERYGVADPESVEFNPDTGTLFVMSSNRTSRVIVETTTSGALLQTIDISASNARAAAGLAYAPASDGSGTKRFYIVDRGVDNNANPNIIDGKMYEMTAPSPTVPDNMPPVANADAYTTAEDTPLNVPAPGVLGNDSDGDGDPLTAVLAAGPANGTLTLNADGSFTYTPNANFNGTDSFTYRANDGKADSNVAMVSITVNPVNDVPVAVDDAYTTDAGATLNVTAPGVLGNDSDVDGDGLTAVLAAGPANGTLTLYSDGSFTYTPAPGFAGADSFTYRANDGQANSNVATVSISVIGAPISVTAIQPNTMKAGTTINVTITGSSFAAGAKVTFESGSGSTPTAANIVVKPDGKSLTANITVKSGGPRRPRVWNVRVTNPDGSSAVLAAGFTVTP